MSLWWLSFKGGTATVVRAETLVHARLLAAADEVARACLFDVGFQVAPEFEQIIPDDLNLGEHCRLTRPLTYVGSVPEGSPFRGPHSLGCLDASLHESQNFCTSQLAFEIVGVLLRKSCTKVGRK